MNDKTGKLRNVLNDPRGEEVCLDTVIKAFAAISDQLRHLEYKNSAHSLREAKKAFRAAKKILVDFEERLKVEITEDIVKALSKVDKRVNPKDAESIREYFGE